MAELTANQALQRLSAEVKWWRGQFHLPPDATGHYQIDWENRAGWKSYRGNAPGTADSIKESDYHKVGNSWCGVTGNKDKKSSERVDKATGRKVYKEANKSVSGGIHVYHFLEAWGEDKFIWHFKIARAAQNKAAGS